jgi:hypothetical protein
VNTSRMPILIENWRPRKIMRSSTGNEMRYKSGGESVMHEIYRTVDWLIRSRQ